MATLSRPDNPLAGDALRRTAERTDIPARLDRLPWSRFHWLVLIALGITWVLDGLEVTLMGAVSGILEDPQTLRLTSADIGFIASAYVAGAVIGSLVFGYLTDRLGRRLLFFVTLAIYLTGVLLTAFSWSAWSFALFRFITGAGIGGEYAAINSAIDELIPARVRGRVDLIVNGTYWIGAALGSLSTLVILDPRLFGANLGWRLGFGVGAALGLTILALRKYIPESPRWLVMHGRCAEADSIVSDIERRIEAGMGRRLAPVAVDYREGCRPAGLAAIVRVMSSTYRRRSILGISLMVAQAFLYNSIFFTYASVLTRYYGVSGQDAGLYLLPFAIGNFLGPVCLGHFFDTVGRRPMISGTYAVSAGLLVLIGVVFQQGAVSATSLTALWTVMFFFASVASSAAYLTVSEVFPLEMRGLAIALFYSIGTGVGGVMAPWLFGMLVGTGSREWILAGYLLAAALMSAAAIVEWRMGVDAERKSLEEISGSC
jgi:MFS family permease